jgi:hypothetical protein
MITYELYQNYETDKALRNYVSRHFYFSSTDLTTIVNINLGLITLNKNNICKYDFSSYNWLIENYTNLKGGTIKNLYKQKYLKYKQKYLKIKN